MITIRPTEQGMKQRVTNAASAAIETVRRRVDSMGTAEATVVRQGTDRILVQFPGLQDTAQLKAIIGQTAKLTFHSVHPTVTAEETKQTRVPLGYKVYPAVEGEGEREYVLQETPVVSGEDLVDAQPGFDQRTNEPIISFRFNQSGARRFGNFTKDNVGSPFAIVLDNKVLSAPVIREAILGGSGQISGNFTVELAGTLAVQLRSGALPTKLTIVEERSVGPSLGADFDRGRQGCRPRRLPLDRHSDHRRLWNVRRIRRRRLDRARLPHHRADDDDRHDAHAAGHRRVRADHRHGGRRQRAHL